MEPLTAILGLISLGTQIFGNLQAAREAEAQKEAMERALQAQLDRATQVYNMILQQATRPMTADLAAHYSALEGRQLQAIRGAASESGLSGSGLETMASQALAGETAANLLRDLFAAQEGRQRVVLEAGRSLADILGNQAALRAGMYGKITEGMGFNFDLLKYLQESGALAGANQWLSSLLGGLFGGTGSAASFSVGNAVSTPTAPAGTAPGFSVGNAYQAPSLGMSF